MQPVTSRTLVFGEVKTESGQLIQFHCSPDDLTNVRQLLAKIPYLNVAVTGEVAIGHGGSKRFSRYTITQHRYAGGGGYIEVLEIANPPDGRCGIVIHNYQGSKGSTFTEWSSVQDAVNAYEAEFIGSGHASHRQSLPGFIRSVDCHGLTPWFYAVGTQVLFGDFVLPENMQDDPVYRCGQKFVVYDSNRIPTIKTCVGCREITVDATRYIHNRYSYRRIYWDDGTIWDDRDSIRYLPRPLRDNEIWITEALDQFRKLLTGFSRQFAINFTDGTRFIGRISIPRSSPVNVQGDYLVRVWLKGKKQPTQGWVRNFEPTPEAPTLLQYISHKLAPPGNVVTRIEVIDQERLVRGKKWAGVFWNPKS